MSASGQSGPTQLCGRAIVGHADLRLGDAVTRVLEAQIAAGDGRFRGIRHSITWDASDVLSRGRTNSLKGQMYDSTWRAGFARLAPLNLTFEALLYHPQLPDLADLARAFPQNHDHPQPCRRAGRDQTLQGQEGRDLCAMKGRHYPGGQVAKCRRQAWRARHAVWHVQLLWA
jgi:hypothetical protein